MRGDLAEEAQDPRLVAPLLLPVREVEGPPRDRHRIIPAAGQKMRLAELGQKERMVDDARRLGVCERLLGEIAAHADPPDSESAEGHYTQALARANDLGMRSLAAHCHLGLGKLFHRTDDRAKAAEHLTIAAVMYRHAPRHPASKLKFLPHRVLLPSKVFTDEWSSRITGLCRIRTPPRLLHETEQ